MSEENVNVLLTICNTA